MWERTCVRRRPRPPERPPVRGAWRGRRSTVQRLPRAGGLGTKSGPLRRPLVVLLVATGRDQLGGAGAHASPRPPAGIEKRVHAHGLPDTHAAELACEGTPMNLIQARLGQSSPATTSR